MAIAEFPISLLHDPELVKATATIPALPEVPARVSSISPNYGPESIIRHLSEQVPSKHFMKQVHAGLADWD